MAEPSSLVVGAGGLAALASKTINSLVTTISEIPSAFGELIRCKNEVQGLQSVLQGLQHGDAYRENDFKSLAFPLQACIRKCEIFKKMLLDVRPSRGERSRDSTRDWVKLKVYEREITDFYEAIPIYRSTISIVLGGANLKYTKVTLSACERLTELIQDTTTKIQAQLQALNGKSKGMRDGGATGGLPLRDWLADLQNEKESMLKCLEICEHVSGNIKDLQVNLLQDSEISSSQRSLNGNDSPIRLQRASSLAGSEDQLEGQLSRLLEALKHRSTNSDRESTTTREEEELLVKLENAIAFSRDIGRKPEDSQTNVIEDFTGGDYSNSYIASEVGALMNAKRVNLGIRSFLVFGQISDIKSIASSGPHEINKSETESQSYTPDIATRHGKGRRI